MMWKKIVLVLTVLIAVILGVINVKPSSVAVTEFRESAHVRLGSSAEIPFSKDITLSGLALTGSWEGPGFAQVWMVSGEQKFLVLDTRLLERTLELSGFGNPFEAVCLQTCSIAPIKPEFLVVLISGPGFLSIDQYHFALPLSPSGLASCPGCKKIPALDTPNHSMLLIVLLLVISVIGAHVLGHVCRNPKTKQTLTLVFIGAFMVLSGVFGVSVASPTGAIAAATQKTASILSALGIIALFVILAIEMMTSKSQEPPKPDVWKDLEEAEEKWEKSK